MKTDSENETLKFTLRTAEIHKQADFDPCFEFIQQLSFVAFVVLRRDLISTNESQHRSHRIANTRPLDTIRLSIPPKPAATVRA